MKNIAMKLGICVMAIFIGGIAFGQTQATQKKIKVYPRKTIAIEELKKDIKAQKVQPKVLPATLPATKQPIRQRAAHPVRLKTK